MTDIFLYNADIAQGLALQFIELVNSKRSGEACTIVLVTSGGDADAAYKIGRYLQERYDRCTVLVPGLCKSAGTLIAIGATEIALAPFGELGPLDVQVTRQDDVGKLESGLNISEALDAIEGRAKDTYHRLIAEIFQASGGVVSTQTALHAASEMVGSIYGPIFSQIDPEEVGSRSRAMRIGEDYAERLNQKWSNLRSTESVRILSRSYPSHGFVIDYTEACGHFNEVRRASENEMSPIEHLGLAARFPLREPDIRYIDITEFSKAETQANATRTGAEESDSEA